MNEEFKELAEKLRQKRKLNNWKEVADLLQIPFSSFDAYLYDRREPKRVVIEILKSKLREKRK